VNRNEVLSIESNFLFLESHTPALRLIYFQKRYKTTKSKIEKTQSKKIHKFTYKLKRTDRFIEKNHKNKEIKKIVFHS